MKKIFALFLFALTVIGSAKAHDFESQIKVSYSHGIDDSVNKSFGAEYVAGLRINNYVRFGAGVGINYCDLLFEEASYSSSMHLFIDEYREAAVAIPIFINGKFNFSDNSISPYFNADLGYSLYVPCSDYAKENNLGLFIKPAFGVDFNIGKGDIFVEVGYNYQTRKFYDSWNYSQVSLSIGYQF